MIEQNKFQDIQFFLDKEDYEKAIMALEKYITDSPEELTYYWYLGLAYLLQENEEEAQNIWLSIFLQGSLEEVEQWTVELTEFLEVQVQENIAQKKLGNAKIIYEVISVINPGYKNSELLNNLVESLSSLALILIDENNRKETVNIYLEILRLNPEHAIYWNHLAYNYYHLGKYEEAEDSIKKALELDNLYAENYRVLGLILEAKNNPVLAIEAYKEAIKKNHGLLDAYADLGSIYLHQNQIDKALEIYKVSFEIAPSQFQSSISDKIANIYDRVGDQSLAALYRGYVAYFNSNNKSAIIHFEKFNSTKIGDVKFYYIFAQCYLRCNQPGAAIELLQKALFQFPQNLILKRLNQLILPVLYSSTEEIDFYRQRFQSLLTNLIAETYLDIPEKKEEVIKFLKLTTNFYLAYQGKNDLEIQKQYVNYVHGIMYQLFPQWCQPKTLQASVTKRKIRIGYISSRLYSLGKLYLNWVKYCNKNKFEIYIYDLSGREENELMNYQKLFKKYSDHIFFTNEKAELTGLCAKVSEDQLDILIMPEIGIDPVYTALSCLRLAPIQCTTWGHPVTSGSPFIDYFLSSELMEPNNGEEHYSETLIRLPNIGFSLPTPTIPSLNKQRSDFQLRKDAIIYLCCQSLFKYLPQHDYIFAMIAQHSTSFQFVFLDPAHGKTVTEAFQTRLAKVFDQLGLNYSEYCTFLPRTGQEDFLMLNQLTDIFLDALSWSGGLTTRHAIACGLPVVTCPGEMMRARHSYGMLKMLGVTETIAKNELEYIKIAVRLGLDHEWRESIRNKITTNKNRIFEDQECILALEDFFQKAIHKKQILNTKNHSVSFET
jgi:protein O-GlcNAc transferase